MHAERESKRNKKLASKAKPAVQSKVIEDSPEDVDEVDPYEKLELAQGQDAGGFKYDAEEKEYILKDYFCLPAKIYERLFEH